MKLDLTTGSIDKLIFRIAIPVGLGYMFHNLLNITDAYFAGQISTPAVAALAKTFPVFFIIIAFSSGFASALTGLISNAVGAKDYTEARTTFFQGLSFAFVTAIITSLFGYIISPYILSYLQPSADTMILSVAYIRIIFLGTTFFILNNFLNSALMAQGDSRTFGYVLLWECILNFILDYIFVTIYQGDSVASVKGIAYATVLVQIFGAIYLGVKVKSSGFIDNYSISNLKPNFKYYWMILKFGIPPVSNMVLVGIGSFFILKFLAPFGDLISAGYMIGLRIEQIFLLPAIGLSIAALSISGQNFGANQWDRILLVYKKCIIYAAVCCLTGGSFIYYIRESLFNKFTKDPVVLKAASEYLFYAIFVSLAYCILHITNSCLQGIRRPGFSFFIGLFRHFIGLALICMFMLNLEDTEASVFRAIVIVNWIAALIAYVYFKLQKPNSL